MLNESPATQQTSTTWMLPGPPVAPLPQQIQVSQPTVAQLAPTLAQQTSRNVMILPHAASNSAPLAQSDVVHTASSLVSFNTLI